MNVNVYKPLKNRKGPEYNCSVFLGGTIDNGDSIDWQTEVIEMLKANDPDGYISYDDDIELDVFNPRRDDWNPKATADDKIEQINWELDHLEESDMIIINILPDSQSPISLMEIGLFKDHKSIIVFCETDYYRYENVETVCDRFSIPLYNTNDSEFIAQKIIDTLY